MGKPKTQRALKDNEAKFVDFRFTDTRGKEQHVSVPARTVDETGPWTMAARRDALSRAVVWERPAVAIGAAVLSAVIATRLRRADALVPAGFSAGGRHRRHVPGRAVRAGRADLQGLKSR